MGTVQAGDLIARGQKAEEKPPLSQKIVQKLQRAEDYVTGSLALIVTAGAFAVLQVHLEYAVGSFLLLNSNRLVQLLRVVRSIPKEERPSGVKEMLVGKR